MCSVSPNQQAVGLYGVPSNVYAHRDKTIDLQQCRVFSYFGRASLVAIHPKSAPLLFPHGHRRPCNGPAHLVEPLLAGCRTLPELVALKTAPPRHLQQRSPLCDVDGANAETCSQVPFVTKESTPCRSQRARPLCADLQPMTTSSKTIERQAASKIRGTPFTMYAQWGGGNVCNTFSTFAAPRVLSAWPRLRT